MFMLDGKVEVRLRGKDTRDQAVERIRKTLLKISSPGSGSGSGRTPKFAIKTRRESSRGEVSPGAAAQPAASSDDGCVLVLQLEDGTQRAVEAEEKPLKLLDKRRKLWFVPPAAMLKAPVVVSPAAAVQHAVTPPTPEEDPPVAEDKRVATWSPPVVAVAVVREEVQLSSVLRMNDKLLNGAESFGAVQSVLAQHAWLTQVPTLYSFSVEAAALDAVNAADARDMRRAQTIDAALRKTMAPAVNRTTKPK